MSGVGTKFYEFLYDWASGVLGSGIPVIRAYQNKAKPTSGEYVAIEDDALFRPVGRPSNYASSDVRDIHFDYMVSPAFWEVGGNGDSLRALAQDLGKMSTRQAFGDAGIGILKIGDIASMPWLSPETQFVREKRMQVEMSVADSVTDSITTIETVELVNNIGEAA